MAKIIMIGPESTGKGGISTVIRNFRQYFPTDHNWQLQYVFSWNEKHKLRYALRSFQQLLIAAHTQKLAIVHFHVSQDASFYRKALLLRAVKKETKTIFHMHAPNFDQFYEKASTKQKNYIRRVLDKVDIIVALGEEWASYYRTLTTTTVIVINNAVFVPEKSSYHPQSMNILTFGRVCERKGSHDIITLAKRIQEQLPKVRFHLYGDRDQTTPAILRRLEESGCTNVEIHGWTSDQQELLKDCGLHLLPSYHEGIPMAVLETMVAGIPNLATDVGGISQVITDRENGFLVVPGAIDEMEERLLSFFSDDKLRKELSEQAKQKIEAQFSLDAYIANWESLYDSLFRG